MIVVPTRFLQVSYILVGDNVGRIDGTPWPNALWLNPVVWSICTPHPTCPHSVMVRGGDQGITFC